MKRSEAEQADGFKKCRKDGRITIYLSTEGLARLTTAEELCLRWLEAQGYLQREGSRSAGKLGKRQVKPTVAVAPDGKLIRPRLYKLIMDIEAIKNASAEGES